MDDLAGLHIIVTRPLAQAEPWAKRLVALGARVSLVPLLDIVAVQNAAQVQAIKNHILDVDVYNKVIFVSQNAATFGFDWLDNYWPQLPAGVNFYAVGKATATLIQQRGVVVTDLAQTQEGDMTSESLLQSPSLQSVRGEKILIMRGVGGRTHLGDELSARGAMVKYCELYERHLPTGAVEHFTQALKKYSAQVLLNNLQKQHAVVTLHSGESLENLVTISQQIMPSEQTLMQQLILLVPSERVAEQAIAAGFGAIFNAENATEACMEQRLQEINASLKN